MSQELQEKILNSIEILKKNENKIFFLTQDTKGNAKAGIKHIYDMAMSLKNSGFDSIILHEKKEYNGVADWLGEEYMTELPHQNIEEQKLQEELSDWKSKIPSGNMGKWHRQVKVDSITDKLVEIQKQIHFHDSIYLSSEIYKQWNTL